MKNNLSANTILCQSNKVVSTNLDDEAVMMSIERGNYYGLDSVGNDIWQFLAEPKSFRELCCHIISKYSVEKTTCEKDIEEFLTEMISEELISISCNQLA